MKELIMPSRIERIVNVFMDIFAVDPITVSVASGANNPRTVSWDPLEEVHAQTIR